MTDDLLLEWYKIGMRDYIEKKKTKPPEPILKTAYKHGGVDAAFYEYSRINVDIINEIRASHADMIIRKIANKK